MTTSCERWRDPIAAAASGDPVIPALETHLATCAPCRRALGDGRTLHARIDGELRLALSELPSPSLLPRVREQLSQRGTSWMPLLVSAAAGLALLLFSIGGWRRPADSSLPTPAADARPAPAPVPSASAPAPVGRRSGPRPDLRRDAAALDDALLSPIPYGEPVRTSALVVAPLDAPPLIELEPLVTVGLDSEGAER